MIMPMIDYYDIDEYDIEALDLLLIDYVNSKVLKFDAENKAIEQEMILDSVNLKSKMGKGKPSDYQDDKQSNSK